MAEGRPDHGKVDQSSTGQSEVQEVVNEPCSGLGCAVRQRGKYPMLEFIIPYLVVLDYLIIATSQFTYL